MTNVVHFHRIEQDIGVLVGNRLLFFGLHYFCRQLISTGGRLELFRQELKTFNYCRMAVFGGYKISSTYYWQYDFFCDKKVRFKNTSTVFWGYHLISTRLAAPFASTGARKERGTLFYIIYTDDPPILDHFVLSWTTLFGPFFAIKIEKHKFFAFFDFFSIFWNRQNFEKTKFLKNFEKISAIFWKISKKAEFFDFKKSKKNQRMQKTCILLFLLQKTAQKGWSKIGRSGQR